MELKQRLDDAIGECERFTRRARPISELLGTCKDGAEYGDSWRDVERAALDAQRALLKVRHRRGTLSSRERRETHENERKEKVEELL